MDLIAGAPDVAALDLRAGEQARLEGARRAGAYVCGSCGFGVRRARPPHHCPMCHGSDWRVERRWRNPAAGDTSSGSAAEAALITLAKRGANRVIHDLASPSSGSDPVGFFCECADPDCHKVVWFAAEVFDRVSAGCTWYALAPGHQAAASDSSEAS